MLSLIGIITKILSWLLFGSGTFLLLKQQYETACWVLFLSSLLLGINDSLATTMLSKGGINMLLKLLSALEKNVKVHDCAINDVLYDYDEEICHECQRDCDECRKASLETLKKLKQSLKNKQAISDKTSYIEEQMRELSRKPLHDAETIARALEKVNNQSDKADCYLEKPMELGQKRETKLQWKEDNDE